MKWLYNVCLVMLAFLAACQTPVDIGGAIRDGVKAGVTAVDRDQNGVITNREIKDSKNDPMTWIAVGSALLGILGLSGAAGASRIAKKVEAETDEQWDELRKLQPKA